MDDDETGFVKFANSNLANLEISELNGTSRSNRVARSVWSTMVKGRNLPPENETVDYYTRIYDQIEKDQHFGPKSFREIESIFYFIFPPEKVARFGKTPLDPSDTDTWSQCNWLMERDAVFRAVNLCTGPRL